MVFKWPWKQLGEMTQRTCVATFKKSNK